MTWDQYIKEKCELINQALDQHLPSAQKEPAILHEAMRYSVFAGGKRLRPVLCLAASGAVKGSDNQALFPAMAVEVLHTYTLIHDDLPAMDNDDLRRGQPTSHIKFGEANAILAGDALLTLSFEWLAHTPAPTHFDLSDLVLELARATGHNGVIAGQIQDLAHEGSTPSVEMVEYIHHHKTARLVDCSLRLGAMAGGGTREQVEHLGAFGRHIGLAFQIKDDLLNEESTPDKLGKGVGTDAEKGKLTYPAVYGIEQAKQLAADHITQSTQHLESLPGPTQPLCDLADFILNRDH